MKIIKIKLAMTDAQAQHMIDLLKEILSELEAIRVNTDN